MLGVLNRRSCHRLLETTPVGGLSNHEAKDRAQSTPEISVVLPPLVPFSFNGAFNGPKVHEEIRLVMFSPSSSGSDHGDVLALWILAASDEPVDWKIR